MDKIEFQNRLQQIITMSEKYKWIYLNNDLKTFRVSLKDELSIYRIDIYMSKMTVCLLPSGDKPIYLKRQNLDMIEHIFKNPYNY